MRRKDGRWFLRVTVNLPADVHLPASDFIGVDFGVVTIATTSDGTKHSGTGVEACRSGYSRRRRSLQQAASAKVKAKVRPKNIRRRLKAISSRESRFRRDVNHCISKKLVASAKDSSRGIAGEDLTYSRDRTWFRKPQRARTFGWAFRAERRAPATLAGTKRRRTGSRKPSSSAASAVMPKRRSECGAEHSVPGARQRAHINAPIVAELCAA